MSLFKTPLVVLDTETTGLLAHSWAAVVEIGAVLLDVEGIERSHFSCLIRPSVLDERADPAFKVNQLSPEILIREGIAPGWARANFERWLQDTGALWLTAYGVHFDREMLARMGFKGAWGWCPCLCLEAKKKMETAGQQPWEGRVWPYPRLTTEAAPFFGVEPVMPAHRALSDARTAARILVALQQKRQEHPLKGAA